MWRGGQCRRSGRGLLACPLLLSAFDSREIYLRELTLCAVRFSTVRNAYGSDSMPSHFTVLPSSGCDRIRSASSDRLKSWASMSRSCRSRFLVPWKSTVGCGSNHSKSTSSMSMSYIRKLFVHKLRIHCGIAGILHTSSLSLSPSWVLFLPSGASGRSSGSFKDFLFTIV